MATEKAPLARGALSSSQHDVDEVEDLFKVEVQPVPLEGTGYARVEPAQGQHDASQPKPGTSIPLLPPGSMSSSAAQGPDAAGAFPSSEPTTMYNTLNEPVMVTLKRDLLRIVSNLWNVVFPNPTRDPRSSPTPLRDWDLWGPFFFIIFLALILSSSASQNKSEVFAVVFGVLSMGAVILTFNVLLLGGQIIFFQSLSVLGYCLFPIDVGAFVCLFVSHKLVRFVVVVVTLAWSSWAAFPFVSGAVSESRKALAVYPVFLLYISVGFLVLAND